MTRYFNSREWGEERRRRKKKSMKKKKSDVIEYRALINFDILGDEKKITMSMVREKEEEEEEKCGGKWTER